MPALSLWINFMCGVHIVYRLCCAIEIASTALHAVPCLLAVWCPSLGEGNFCRGAHVRSCLLWQMRARPMCSVDDRWCVA